MGVQPDQQQSHQQWQEQHTELVGELLKTCLLRRHKDVVPRLVSLPAARRIGKEAQGNEQSRRKATVTGGSKTRFVQAVMQVQCSTPSLRHPCDLPLVDH